MFVNNINPDLVSLGPVSIRFYGIVYAAGFLLVSYLLSREASRGRIKNLDKDKALDFTMYGLVFGIIGARIFHVLSDFHLYKNNLIEVFFIWKGGLGFIGGLAFGLGFAYFYCKRHKIDFFHALDIVAVPVPLIIGLGRIANFMNSEHLGHASNFPWCVVYQKVDLICRHPTQIYEAISMLMLFFVLLVLSKNIKAKRGFLTWIFIFGYGILRFATEFFREGSRPVLGLGLSQFFSLTMILLGAYKLYDLTNEKYHENPEM